MMKIWRRDLEGAAGRECTFPMLLCREVVEGAGATKLPTVSYLVSIVAAFRAGRNCL